MNQVPTLFAALLLPLTAAAAPAETELLLPAMNCPSCAVTVKAALTRLEGVEDIAIDGKAQRVNVRFNDAITSAELIRDRLANAGYPPADTTDTHND